MNLIHFLLYLTILALATAKPTIQYEHVFLLAGQSNMVGYGGMNNASVPWDRIVPPECSPDNSRIFRLNINNVWEVATEPIHLGIDGENHNVGIGLGMSFANHIKSHLAGAIGLVPCAMSGTYIEGWQRGQFLYERMISRAKAAASSGNLKAMLWYQGENDSLNQEHADRYRQRMVDLFTDIRVDLNLPGLPIIQVAIASGGRFREAIRKLQKELVMPNVTYVDANGLKLNSDQVHLTTASQVTLGGMLGDEFIRSFLI